VPPLFLSLFLLRSKWPPRPCREVWWPWRGLPRGTLCPLLWPSWSALAPGNACAVTKRVVARVAFFARAVVAPELTVTPARPLSPAAAAAATALLLDVGGSSTGADRRLGANVRRELERSQLALAVQPSGGGSPASSLRFEVNTNLALGQPVKVAGGTAAMDASATPATDGVRGQEVDPDALSVATSVCAIGSTSNARYVSTVTVLLPLSSPRDNLTVKLRGPGAFTTKYCTPDQKAQTSTLCVSLIYPYIHLILYDIIYLFLINVC
jgi:hypothetical protein